MKKAGRICGTLFAYGIFAIFPMVKLAIFSHQLHHPVIMWLGILLSATYSGSLVIELTTKKKFRAGTNWK